MTEKPEATKPIKVTIICDDNFAAFDGEGYNFDLPLAKGLHAVQGVSSDNFKTGLNFEWKTADVVEGFQAQEYVQAVYEEWLKVKEANKHIPPTIEELKIKFKQAVESLAENYRRMISGTQYAFKLATYERKAEAAKRVLADPDNISEGDAALLVPEAKERGLTILEHCKIIIQKNSLFLSAAGLIEAIEAQGKAAVNAAQTVEELETLGEIIPKKAAEAFDAWKQNNGT